MNILKFGLAVLADAGLYVLMRVHGGFAARFLFYTVLGSLVFALLFRYLLLPRVTVLRGMPERTYWSGDDLEIELEIKIVSRFPAAWILLQEEWKDELRDRRHERRQFIVPGFRRTVKTHYATGRLARGRYTFLPLRVSSGDLFGFVSRTWEVPVDGEFLVCPAPAVIPGLSAQLLPGLRDLEGGAMQDAPMHVLKGLREYRHGDPLKLVHWKSLARTHQLMVKEYEEDSYPYVSILLDSSSPAMNAPGLMDSAVHAAAGVLRYCGQRRLSCELTLDGDNTRRIADASPAQNPEAYAGLAAVEPKPGVDFAEILKREALSAIVPSVLVCISGRLDDDFTAILQESNQLQGRLIFVFCSADPVLTLKDRQRLKQLEDAGCSVVSVAGLAETQSKGSEVNAS